MSFMSSLAANPSGSGIYGQSGQNQDDDVLGIVNKLKDREMADFQNKANFMADLSVKQDRLRRLYDMDGSMNGPQGQGMNTQGGQNTQGMNTVMGHDPNEMTGYQKGELGIRQQALAQNQQEITQKSKLGQEALDLKTQQEKLNQQKSDQINSLKQQDMQRKIEEANNKFELAQKTLNDRNSNAQQQLEAHKALAAAMEERHKLELAQKNAQFETASKQHQAQIDALNERLKQAGRTRTTIEQGGETRTTTTEKGSAAERIKVIGPDGTPGYIPADKLDDWNKNHAPQATPDDQQEEQ